MTNDDRDNSALHHFKKCPVLELYSSISFNNNIVLYWNPVDWRILARMISWIVLNRFFTRFVSVAVVWYG